MRADSLILGIDTGGTFTDAVLVNPDGAVVAKAKSITTHGELQTGITRAIGAVLDGIEGAAARIIQVSLSTTLATNALVEGQGGPSGLVMIGFTPAEAERAGLRAALGIDPVVFCAGGHDVHGRAAQLDLSPLDDWLHRLGNVMGFAVAACFATRNPEHEIAAARLLHVRTGRPVTMSHELSPRLGGPKRALTTLFNARLVPLVDGLLSALESDLTARGIQAPLMVVRGDGSLVSTGFARQRPIETILSGPAASVIGARHLTGADKAIVSDIGGTTTDIAILQDGLPRIDPDGAVIGGHRTMVEAVAIRTFGLGGDSEVSFDETALDPVLTLGPRRAIPLSLLATIAPDTVLNTLDRQLSGYLPPRHAGRFAVPVPGFMAADAPDAPARAILAALEDGPRAITDLALSSPAHAALDRLVRLGMVRIAAFTPSDAAHVLGRQAIWNAEAARHAAEIFARRRTGAGKPVASSAETLCQTVLTAVTRRTAEVICATAFMEDGLPGDAIVEGTLFHKALARDHGITRAMVTLDRAVVGLGASAAIHYDGLSALTSVETIIPNHADVANAVGAASGLVRVTAEIAIAAPAEDRFRVMFADGPEDFQTLEDAVAAARGALERLIQDRAATAGAIDPAITLEDDMRFVPMEARNLFIEGRVIATASGRPRFGTR